MTRALVSGASGLLGSHLVERLVEAGVAVRALVRPQSDVRCLATLPVEVVRLAEPTAELVSRAVTGCQLVFHCAARFDFTSAFQPESEDAVSARTNLELHDRPRRIERARPRAPVGLLQLGGRLRPRCREPGGGGRGSRSSLRLRAREARRRGDRPHRAGPGPARHRHPPVHHVRASGSSLHPGAVDAGQSPASAAARRRPPSHRPRSRPGRGGAGVAGQPARRRRGTCLQRRLRSPGHAAGGGQDPARDHPAARPPRPSNPRGPRSPPSGARPPLPRRGRAGDRGHPHPAGPHLPDARRVLRRDARPGRPGLPAGRASDRGSRGSAGNPERPGGHHGRARSSPSAGEGAAPLHEILRIAALIPPTGDASRRGVAFDRPWGGR